MANACVFLAVPYILRETLCPLWFHSLISLNNSSPNTGEPTVKCRSLHHSQFPETARPRRQESSNTSHHPNIDNDLTYAVRISEKLVLFLWRSFSALRHTVIIVNVMIQTVEDADGVVRWFAAKRINRLLLPVKVEAFRPGSNITFV